MSYNPPPGGNGSGYASGSGYSYTGQPGQQMYPTQQASQAPAPGQYYLPNQIPAQQPGSVLSLEWYPMHTTAARADLRVYDLNLPPLPERVGPPVPRAGDTKASWTLRARQKAVPEDVIEMWLLGTMWPEDFRFTISTAPAQPPGPNLPPLPQGLEPLDIDQESYSQWQWRARRAGLTDALIRAHWSWAIGPGRRGRR